MLGAYMITMFMSPYGCFPWVLWSPLLRLFLWPLFWSHFFLLFSCRQHMCGLCFLIHSAILYLLIGTFNTYTFKVIIDRYLFTTMSSFCACVPFSLFLFLKAVTLASLVMLVWWRCTFSLYFSGKFLILPSILMRASLGKVVLVGGLCFSLLEYFLPFSPGPLFVCCEISL